MALSVNKTTIMLLSNLVTGSDYGSFLNLFCMVINNFLIYVTDYGYDCISMKNYAGKYLLYFF